MPRARRARSDEEATDRWPLSVLLRTANHVVQEHRATYLKSLGLTAAGATALAMLARGPLTQRELSSRALVGEQTIGETLERLERLGQVVRQRDATDRRRIMVALTPAGQQALEKALEADPLHQVLRKPEFDALRRGLAEVIRLVEAARRNEDTRPIQP